MSYARPLRRIHCPCGRYLGVGHSNHSVCCSPACESLRPVRPQEVRNSLLTYLHARDPARWSASSLARLTGVDYASVTPVLKYP